jgi:hypothetical protein
MKRTNRFGAALVLAGMMASGLAASTARLEAKGRGNDGGDISTLCSVLLTVIDNPTLSQSIRDIAQFAYDFLGCS